MDPVLHHTAATLVAGDHTFDFGWTVPADLGFEPHRSFGLALNGLLPRRHVGAPDRLTDATIAGPIAVLFQAPPTAASDP
jgi:hypothetical protein